MYKTGSHSFLIRWGEQSPWPCAVLEYVPAGVSGPSWVRLAPRLADLTYDLVSLGLVHAQKHSLDTCGFFLALAVCGPKCLLHLWCSSDSTAELPGSPGRLIGRSTCLPSIQYPCTVGIGVVWEATPEDSLSDLWPKLLVVGHPKWSAFLSSQWYLLSSTPTPFQAQTLRRYVISYQVLWLCCQGQKSYLLSYRRESL